MSSLNLSALVTALGNNAPAISAVAAAFTTVSGQLSAGSAASSQINQYLNQIQLAEVMANSTQVSALANAIAALPGCPMEISMVAGQLAVNASDPVKVSTYVGILKNLNSSPTVQASIANQLSTVANTLSTTLPS